jgi:CRP-like cAMP-binding protein
MFLGLPHTVGGEVLVNSRLVHIPARAVVAEVKRNPEFARRVILSLSARLHHLISGLEGYTLRSGTQRVVGYLLSHLPVDHTDNHLTLTLPAQKRIIASQLNLTQEHFSRILHELIAKGMIEVHGKVVTICDLDALRGEAAGPAPPRAFVEAAQSGSTALC